MSCTLPAHLFASEDGSLWDTREPNWSNGRPVRALYRRTSQTVETIAELKATLRAGGHTWPGAYPLYFVTNDGEALSFEAVRAEFCNVADSILRDMRDGWRVVAVAVNYEDEELTCAHTGKRIPSAYGEA